MPVNGVAPTHDSGPVATEGHGAGAPRGGQRAASATRLARVGVARVGAITIAPGGAVRAEAAALIIARLPSGLRGRGGPSSFDTSAKPAKGPTPSGSIIAAAGIFSRPPCLAPRTCLGIGHGGAGAGRPGTIVKRARNGWSAAAPCTVAIGPCVRGWPRDRGTYAT